MPNSAMPNNAIPLSALMQALGNTIRLTPSLQGVWVMAELSDVRVAGGHCYMELLEKDTAGGTRAKVRAMIWSSTFMALRRKFYEATQRDIVSGLKVLVRGSVTHHNIYGLSFNIIDIDPSYTLGDMERLRREILERLKREGILHRNQGLQLPPNPQRIAIISAAGAAGYGDFMNQLNSNPEGFALYPALFPAIMQGERTASTVCDALDKIEMTLDMWDCVVIIRGGGATTDLNGFDNYDLARRVALCPLPVIVGIGHERDRTVLDEIACVRCKTPTAAAAYILDVLRNALASAMSMVRAIADYGAAALKGEHLRLANFAQTIPALAVNSISREKLRLSASAMKIPNTVRSRIMQEKMRLSSLAGECSQRAQSRISNNSAKIDRLASRIVAASEATLSKQKLSIERLADMLRVLNPENTLRRGFSITRIAGKAVTNAGNVPPGTVIETILHTGKIKSRTE